jgi:hypothetical protein
VLAQCLFFGAPTEADNPFSKVAGAVAASFFCLGFFVSLLLRFCPLATTFSFIDPKLSERLRFNYEMQALAWPEPITTVQQGRLIGANQKGWAISLAPAFLLKHMEL